MGTASFLQTRYAMLWLGLLALIAYGTWHFVFVAKQPVALGPVSAVDVKTEAVQAPEDAAKKIEKPLEPMRAFLDQVRFSLTSPDGQTQLEVRARQAQKRENSYSLKRGSLEFTQDKQLQLEITITDATYNVENGVARVVGSMDGRLPVSGQTFTAQHLRWDETTNIVTADVVKYSADRFEVTGESMRIELSTGRVQFSGPVNAIVQGALKT
jgi:lipopolysaccharide export system protein LptC